MPAEVRINLDTRGLSQKLANAGPKGFAYLQRTTQYYSLTAESRAKANALWTDQTGNARSGLTGQASSSGSSAGGAEFVVSLFHRVSYGIWLEGRHFSHKGDLGIIGPTMTKIAPELMRAVTQIFQRMF